MRLTLLVTTLCVVWSGFVSAAATDRICQHDGFFNGTVCVCKPGFSGDSCQKRICLNDGVARTGVGVAFDNGCYCPPGFLGANCQPTKCVDGDSKAFYAEESDKMISVYITSNIDLQNKMTANDDPMKAICTTFTNSTYNTLLVYYGSSRIRLPKENCRDTFNTTILEDCVNDHDNLIHPSCPGTDSLSINVKAISTVVDNTTPNSQLFIITNYPLANVVDQDVQNVVKKAISKRLTIHSLVFTTPDVMDYTEFANPNNTGYQALKTIAESTLGAYVTPYSGTASNLFRKSNNQKAAKKLLSMAKNGITPAAMFSTRTPSPQVLYIGKGNVFYASSRVQDIDYNPFEGQFFNFSSFHPLPTNTSYAIDTGYYKMAKAIATDDLIQFFMNDRTLPQSNVLIFTEKTADVYPAITTSEIVDASSPYGNVESGARTLVGKLANPALILNPQFTSFYPSGLITLDNSTYSTRPGCQFSVTLGTVQCIQTNAAFLQLRTVDFVGSVTPFYCVGNAQTTEGKSFEFEEDFLVSEADADKKCTDSGDAASKLTTNQRSFVIISRNAREIDPSTNRPTANSPVDRLYINKGNVFSYLLKQQAQTNATFYKQFVYNLVDKTSVTNTDAPRGNDSALIFMNNVMNITAEATDVNENTDLPWLDALKDTAGFLAGLNTGQKDGSSDIFLVIDNGTFTVDFEKDVKLFEDLYTSRSRLFILALDTYESYAPGKTQSMVLAAARTGGTLLRFTDYDDLQKFFDNYFLSEGEVYISQSDVVYQHLLPFALTVQTDPINMPEQLETYNVSYTLVIYGTTEVLDVTMNCGSSTKEPLNATSTFGEANIFSLSSLQGENVCSFFVMFAGPQARAVNVLVYAKNKELPLSTRSIVGFTNNPTTSVSQPLLNFAKRDPQYPVATQPNTVLTILDSSRNVVLTSNMTSRQSCFDFNSILNYNFQCTKANDFYYFQTTFLDESNSLHTRTFVTQCISEMGKCLNGGQFENGACVCPVGFKGDICETPICQNGGTITPANTCSCVDGFTGDFCQISAAGCINMPTIPDSRSEVTSLIFVMEATAGVTFTTVSQLPGVQITVVQWNCKNITTTQLGTDATKLKNAVPGGITPCEPSSDNAVNALLAGFKSQATDRAVVVFFINSNFTPTNFNQDVYNKLASQRVDLRIFSTKTPNPDLDLLAQFGNGIVYQDDAVNFGFYFSNYTATLFQPKVNSYNTGVPRLAVAQSGTGPLNSLTLFKDEAELSTVKYIVHTFNGVVTVKGQPATSTFGSGESKIQFFSVAQADAEFVITGDNTTKYSIEKMTVLPLAFGFQDNGINEGLQFGLRTGVTNFLSLYTPRSFDSEDLPSMPEVIVTKLGMDGSSNAPVILPTTHKNHNCMYSYYSIPISCDESTLGYSASILTFTESGKARQEQKMLVCQKAALGTCVNGQLADGSCKCNGGWTGLECNLPICSSGSSRYGSACMCGPGSSGANCGTNDVETTVSPNAARAFVFILDSRGADENLYNMSIATIQDFMTMYNPDALVLFVSNVGPASETLFLPYDSKTIVNSIEKLRSLRDNTNTFQDVSPAFDTIYNKLQEAINKPSLASAFVAPPQNTEINNIFYMALTGVNLTSTANMEILKANYKFQVSSVFFTATDASSDLAKSQISSIITNLGSNLQVSNNTNDAFLFMRTESQGAPITPIIPPIRTYSCVKKVQSNIFIFTELSNVPNLSTYRQTYSGFLKSFRSDFERSSGYPVNRTIDPNACAVDMNRFSEQSLISGFVFYNRSTGGISSSFCGSDLNYKNLEKKVADTTAFGAPTPEWPRLTLYFNKALSAPCQCSRMNDSSTLKIAIWMVVSDGSDADASQFTDNKFVHLVVPFGMDIVKDSFYYNLAKSNIGKFQGDPFSTTDNFNPGNYILPKADSYTADQLVQEVWTKICQITGKIPNDNSTAAPPQAQNIQQDDMQQFYGESETEF